ncbi:putative F-box domain-containing protein [Arabidopsis thaliana]
MKQNFKTFSVQNSEKFLSKFRILGFSNAMEKSQKQVTRPSNSRREYSKEIPIDLLIEIFSRLSTGDIARCRCVSKLWSSVPRLRDFTELFLKISSARPRILFTFLHNGKRMFYSISQHLHSDPSSSPLVPYYHMSFSKGMVPSYDNEIHAPVRGFLCSKASVYNPSTGECAYPYLELLVLCVPKVLLASEDFACRVSTLGTEEVCWRMIQCSLPHRPFRDEICIDGVLYYLAKCIGN